MPVEDTLSEEKKEQIRDFTQGFISYVDEEFSERIDAIMKEAMTIAENPPLSFRDAWRMSKLNKQVKKLQKRMNKELKRRGKVFSVNFKKCNE